MGLNRGGSLEGDFKLSEGCFYIFILENETSNLEQKITYFKKLIKYYSF